ncbi:MAG TPA: hypothetical protein VFH54_06380 [Mycobacteriales bacterium]|nr:hypothetical protein [Mycobacteriales bacterium]
MALARVFDGNGWTAEQYDALLERLLDQLGQGRRTAPGVLFHWSAATDGGMQAVDVYDSRESADDLAGRIGPIAAELGMAMPDITEYEVHNYLTP